jgi:Tfp pilus assembly protein PilN
MDRVNLLPDEAHLGIRDRLVYLVERQFLRVLASVVGAVVATAFLFWVGQAMTLRKAEGRLVAFRQEIQVLQVEGKNLESFSKQLDQVEAELHRQKEMLDWKIEYLKTTREHPQRWAALLKDLRRNIPQGVWLSELETGPQASLRISGGAADEALVSQFMSNLKESTHFTHVGFSYTEKGNIGNVPIVRFEIVCRVA